jgi:lysophospholipase L1-like esterase
MFEPRVRALSRVAICLAVLAVSACAHRPVSGAPERSDGHWVATWTASLQRTEPEDRSLHIAGQTLRQIVRISLGGNRLRLRLSNAFGAAPLHVGAVHLALHGSGPSIAAGSDRSVTFAASSNVSIPEGALVVSDAVSLAAPALSELVVSVYLPDDLAPTTVHDVARQTSYLSPAGDFTGAEGFSGASTTRSWYFLAGVDVEAPLRSQAIVALGDSITDGLTSTLDANHRWPDHLAERLNRSRQAVVNAGIAGNRVLGDLGGPGALARLDRDVLAQPGARYVILLEGINDVAMEGQEVSAEQIIAGHRQVILRAQALGLRVIGGTLTPYAGSTRHIRYTEAGEQKRDAINRWIRSSGAFDGVIDFDQATRDPDHPTRLLPAFDSGDHLHPNDAGYKAMADAVDLSLFDATRD